MPQTSLTSLLERLAQSQLDASARPATIAPMEERLSAILADLDRCHTGLPASFGNCPQCGGRARAGGLCGDCNESRLAGLVGGVMAKRYRDCLRELRSLEAEMRDMVGE